MIKKLKYRKKKDKVKINRENYCKNMMMIKKIKWHQFKDN